MNKHSHFIAFFSIQTRGEALKRQSCRWKGWGLCIAMITASYWPLISFFWVNRYSETPPKQGTFWAVRISRIFRGSERRQRKPGLQHVYRQGLRTSGRRLGFLGPAAAPMWITHVRAMCIIA